MFKESSLKEHDRRWIGFAKKLDIALSESGLVANQDYWFCDPFELDPNNVIELRSAELATAEVLLACDRAVRDQWDWGVILIVREPDGASRKVVPLVQTNGGGFTPLSGGGRRIRIAIYEAIRKRGDAWLKNVPPPYEA